MTELIQQILNLLGLSTQTIERIFLYILIFQALWGVWKWIVEKILSKVWVNDQPQPILDEDIANKQQKLQLQNLQTKNGGRFVQGLTFEIKRHWWGFTLKIKHPPIGVTQKVEEKKAN